MLRAKPILFTYNKIKVASTEAATLQPRLYSLDPHQRDDFYSFRLQFYK